MDKERKEGGRKEVRLGKEGRKRGAIRLWVEESRRRYGSEITEGVRNECKKKDRCCEGRKKGGKYLD